MQLAVRDLAKQYRKKPVLRRIDFTAESGRCVGILGSNGSGKSTLLSILAGVRRCDRGEFLCDGHDLLCLPKQRAKLLGYVPQGTPLFEELTAWDNLRLWYDAATLKRELSGGLLAALELSDFLKKPVGKLSGGMKKRLSIACAVAHRPPVLLLDEPMAALDLACKQKILSYLRAHKAAGGILLLATHDLLELELCDECYILKDGVLTPFVYDGTLESVVRGLDA